MFDSLRRDISLSWHRSDVLLERMSKASYTPKKCECCGEWYMGSKFRDSFYCDDDICDKCFLKQWDGDPLYPTWRQRLYIAFHLLRKGPYENWRNARHGWKYVSPLLKAVLCLVVDHQITIEARNRGFDDVGSVGIPNNPGWWIVEVHPQFWGYKLDHDWPDHMW